MDHCINDNLKWFSGNITKILQLKEVLEKDVVVVHLVSVGIPRGVDPKRIEVQRRGIA